MARPRVFLCTSQGTKVNSSHKEDRKSVHHEDKRNGLVEGRNAREWAGVGLPFMQPRYGMVSETMDVVRCTFTPLCFRLTSLDLFWKTRCLGKGDGELYFHGVSTVNRLKSHIGTTWPHSKGCDWQRKANKG